MRTPRPLKCFNGNKHIFFLPIFQTHSSIHQKYDIESVNHSKVCIHVTPDRNCQVSFISVAATVAHTHKNKLLLHFVDIFSMHLQWGKIFGGECVYFMNFTCILACMRCKCKCKMHKVHYTDMCVFQETISTHTYITY